MPSEKRIRIPRAFRQWLEEAIAKFPVNVGPVTQEVALVSGEIHLSHRGPADHFLAATALVYDLVVMTVDQRLAKAKWLPWRSR